MTVLQPRYQLAAMRRDLERVQMHIECMLEANVVTPEQQQLVDRLIELFDGPKATARRVYLVDVIEYVHDGLARDKLLRVLCKRELHMACSPQDVTLLRRSSRHARAASEALSELMGDQETLVAVREILAGVADLAPRQAKARLAELWRGGDPSMHGDSPARRAYRVCSWALGAIRTFGNPADSVRYWFLQDYIEHSEAVRNTSDKILLSAVESCRDGHPLAGRKHAGKWERLAKLCASFGLGHVAPDTLRKECDAAARRSPAVRTSRPRHN